METTDQRAQIVAKLNKRTFLSQIGIMILFIGFVVIAVLFPKRLGVIWFSFLCGALGGSLFLLQQIRSASTKKLMELESTLYSTLMPLLYGGILAVLVYFCFIGCILTGDGQGGLFTSNLFPIFEGLKCGQAASNSTDPITMASIIQIKPKTFQDFFKVLVWSVLSGYSEKFVYRILETLEKQK